MKNHWLDKKYERHMSQAPVYQDDDWTFRLVSDDDLLDSIVSDTPAVPGGSITIVSGFDSADTPVTTTIPCQTFLARTITDVITVGAYPVFPALIA